MDVGVALVISAGALSVGLVVATGLFTRVLAKLNLTISTQAPPPAAVSPEEIAKLVQQFEGELQSAIPAPRGQMTYESAAEDFYGTDLEVG